jgi:hypothetical protein
MKANVLHPTCHIHLFHYSQRRERGQVRQVLHPFDVLIINQITCGARTPHGDTSRNKSSFFIAVPSMSWQMIELKEKET